MHPGTIASLFLIIFGLMEFFLRRGTTAKSLKAGSFDRGTTLLILISYVGAILALSIDLPGLVWVQGLLWVGVGLSAGGTALRIWSMKTLGQYYTRTLVATSNQQVVQQDPYRLRHPGYLAALLIWVGAAVALGSVRATIFVFVLLIITYRYRIRNEEQMLIESFCSAYADYCKQTWRLIPFIY